MAVPDEGAVIAPRQRLAAPALVFLAGVAMVAGTSALETALVPHHPWEHAAIVEDVHDGAQDGQEASARRDVLPVKTRPAGRSPRGLGLVTALSTHSVRGALRPDLDEQLVSVALPADDWRLLTASGRPPQTTPPAGDGPVEVLAGCLTRDRAFTVDGVRFAVVGRLPRQIADLSLVYLAPASAGAEPVFAPSAGGKEARLELERTGSAEDTPEGPAASPSHVRMPTLRPAWAAVGTLLGLVLVAVGGSIAQLRLLRRCARGFLQPARAILDVRRGVLLSFHVAAYAAFLGCMAGGALAPVANLQVINWVSDIFTAGPLRNIGSAYQAGDIAGAAWHTFLNNFFRITFLLTIVPAVLLPVLGSVFALGRSLASLMIAGFVIAPIWTDIGRMLSYHSITLAIEFEAYILAALLVTLFPIRLFRGLSAPKPATALAENVQMVVAGAVVTAGLLAVAAVYEAATLVILG